MDARERQRRTAEEFDSYDDRYSNAVNDAVSFSGLNVDYFTHVKAEYLLNLIKDKLGDATKVSALDIGCGVGNFHSLLTPFLKSLDGIDVSGGSVSKARESHPEVSYRVYNGGELPYEDAKFDLAFTICVMHHVPPEDWKLFVSEMHRVVRPGGVGVVFEHNPQNPLTMRAVNRCPFDKDATLLKSERTVNILEAAGFDKVERRFILSVPAKGRLLQKVDRLFSRIPFGAQYYVVGNRT